MNQSEGTQRVCGRQRKIGNNNGEWRCRLNVCLLLKVSKRGSGMDRNREMESENHTNRERTERCTSMFTFYVDIDKRRRRDERVIILFMLLLFAII